MISNISSMSNLIWNLYKPSVPVIGDCWFDTSKKQGYIWQGTTWMPFTGDPGPTFIPPTKEQLEKHPALKTAWEEYVVIKRLLGV